VASELASTQTAGIAARSSGRLELERALTDAHERTWSVLANLTPEQWHVPYHPGINPPLWEFGHVAWFNEWWVLRDAYWNAREENVTRRPSMLSGADRWFDSGRIAHVDRWTLDTKVNWNATSKLNIFGRYSQLDFWTFNETVYGDQLQGMPIGGGNPGTGTGGTYNFSAGATYVFTTNLVADAHFGYVRQSVSVEHTDIGQNKGQSLFGLPGLNGPRNFEGGMPVRVFGTVQDVTEQRRTQEQFRDLVESAPDAMVIANTGGTIVLVNAQAERLPM